MKIKIVFLGTSSAVPTAKRNHQSILVSYNSENILIDCGEGTQRQFRYAKLNPCKLTKMLITHWHGDHILGIPGLLQTLAMNNYRKTLHIYGPKGTIKYFRLIEHAFIPVGKIKTKIHEVSEGVFINEKDFKIEAKNMIHGPITLAYSFIEKGKIRLDKQKLARFKIPNSPLLSKIKQGKNIKYKGQLIRAKDMIYKQEGKKITIITDTKINNSAIKLAKDSDILISEATFNKDYQDKAGEYKHLSSVDAATIAKKSKSKKLILTHLSQRNEKHEKQILDEAKKIFPNTKMANDLMKVEI